MIVFGARKAAKFSESAEKRLENRTKTGIGSI